MMELSKAGFKVDNPKDTLADIAESKNTSGMGVYEVIKKLEAKPKAITPGTAWTAEKVRKRLPVPAWAEKPSVRLSQT